jgi:hypothetical protein
MDGEGGLGWDGRMRGFIHVEQAHMAMNASDLAAHIRHT